MAELDQEFNAADVPEDDRSFDPIPAGDYQMQVIESDKKPNKNGTGEIITLTLEVIDGPHANRRIWDRLNYRHENPEAQRIAHQSLAELCRAIGLGLTSVTNTEQLHFKPFVGRVTVKPAKGEYGPSNAVRYKPRGGTVPVGKAAPVQQPTERRSGAQTAERPTAGTAQTAPGARPWKKTA